MSGSDTSASWKRAGWNNSTITSLALNDGKAAIDFYVKAFGAVIVDETLGPNGQLFHASLRLGDTMLMAGEVAPGMGIGPSSISLYVYVPDADAAYKRAVDAGVTELQPVQEWFWGTPLQLTRTHSLPLSRNTRTHSPA